MYLPSVLQHCQLSERKVIRLVWNWMLVCWWWRFDWSFARLMAPVVAATSSSNWEWWRSGTGLLRLSWKMVVKQVLLLMMMMMMMMMINFHSSICCGYAMMKVVHKVVATVVIIMIFDVMIILLGLVMGFLYPLATGITFSLSILTAIFSRWTWVGLVLLELRMMEVVVTTGDTQTCKDPVKSSPPTNQHPMFYRPDALPVAKPTVSEHWRERQQDLHCVCKNFIVAVSKGSHLGDVAWLVATV